MGTAVKTTVLTPDFFQLPQERKGMAVILLNAVRKVAMIRKPSIHVVGGGEPGFDYQFPQDYYDDGNGELQGQAARRILGKRLALAPRDLELLDVSKLPTVSPLPEKFAFEKHAQSLVHDWALVQLKPGVSDQDIITDVPTSMVVWVDWWQSWDLCNSKRHPTYWTACHEFSAYLPDDAVMPGMG